MSDNTTNDEAPLFDGAHINEPNQHKQATTSAGHCKPARRRDAAGIVSLRASFGGGWTWEPPQGSHTMAGGVLGAELDENAGNGPKAATRQALASLGGVLGVLGDAATGDTTQQNTENGEVPSPSPLSPGAEEVNDAPHGPRPFVCGGGTEPQRRELVKPELR